MVIFMNAYNIIYDLLFIELMFLQEILSKTKFIKSELLTVS